MPRAEARSVKADARDAPAVVRESTSGEGAVHLIVAGLMARLEGSSLMRRVPAQCTPEEQRRLIGMLSGLAELRASLVALDDVPGLDLALVEEVWPELAALVAPAIPRGARRPAVGQGSSGNGVAGARTSVRPAAPVEETIPIEQPPVDEEIAFAPAAPAAPTRAAAPAAPIRAAAPPARPGGLLPRVSAPPEGRDLGEAVRGVLRTDSRPWSASRIAARLQEVDPLATRQEVYDTLWHHADLFRKTGHGWELIAR